MKKRSDTWKKFQMEDYMMRMIWSKQIVRTAKAVMTAVTGMGVLSFWIRMMSVD